MSKTEQYIEITNNGRCLRGMVHIPLIPNPTPLIIVHGYFSANKIGPQRLFFLLAQSLAKMGYKVYRFDLSGMGESDGDISKITFADHVDDLRAMVQTVSQLNGGQRVTVVAHCMGCNLTLSNIERNPEVFGEVVFLAPYYSNDVTLSRLFEADALKQLREQNFTYRKGLYADSSFFTESDEAKFVSKMNNISDTINVIIPTKDQFMPFDCNQNVLSKLCRVAVKYVVNADHNFLDTQREVIDLVAKVLKDKQNAKKNNIN